MVSNFGAGPTKGTDSGERTLLRLAVLAVLIVAGFVALFSRLWFLQVLASEDYRQLAKENRVRLVYSEPPRGRILDRNGVVIVDNRYSLAVTVDRQVIDSSRRQHRLLNKLSKLLDEPRKDLRTRLFDVSASPYKPVPVAYDVEQQDVTRILENHENYRGVGVEKLPVRTYMRGGLAAQVLGYLGEISPEDFKTDYFKGATPRYRAGDIVGKAGVERVYDRYLRGRPEIRKVVVNSAGEVIGSKLIQEERPGKDLVLALDSRIQKISEKALRSGVEAARGAGFQAPDGAAVVMDPQTGGIVAMASFPDYDPSILADGFSNRDAARLGARTVNDNTDDALVNRAIQAAIPPGSTFKVVTAEAAIATGVFSPTGTLDCPGVFHYGLDQHPFNNWTSANFGSIGLARSLTISCNTFYDQLGAKMEDRWGAANGDGSERFQKYMRRAGFGHTTGIDLPGETTGRVPDEEWCDYIAMETDGAICGTGWQPGYTVNMSIGQGDLIVSPLQMAVNYAAIANGGDVLQPRVATALARPDAATGEEKVVKEIKSRRVANLGLDQVTYDLMHQGLEGVVSSGEGTAASAFAGFRHERVSVAGKTGTAQIGSVTSGLNFAWFISYAPADEAEYVIAVYIEKAGHGGESAAPVARQIYEGIYNLDEDTGVQLAEDQSG